MSAKGNAPNRRVAAIQAKKKRKQHKKSKQGEGQNSNKDRERNRDAKPVVEAVDKNRSFEEVSIVYFPSSYLPCVKLAVYLFYIQLLKLLYFIKKEALLLLTVEHRIFITNCATILNIPILNLVFRTCHSLNESRLILRLNLVQQDKLIFEQSYLPAEIKQQPMIKLMIALLVMMLKMSSRRMLKLSELLEL